MASANKVKQYFVNHFRGQTASFMCLPMQLVKLNVDINVNLCIMPSKLLLYIFYKNVYALRSGVSRNSRSLPFPRMKASDSLSRFMEMDFFIPFPFPNFGNVFFIPFPFPNLLFHRRESKRELDYCKRYQASNFFSFLYISQNNYIEEVNWAKMFKSEWLKRQDIMLSFVANSFAAKVLLIVNKIILFWFLFFNSGLDHNDPSKPSHRLTNGPEPSKTIESDGSNIKKPS